MPIRIPFPQIKVRPVVAESLSLLHPLKVEIVEFLEDEHDLQFKVEFPAPEFCTACGAIGQSIRFSKSDCFNHEMCLRCVRNRWSTHMNRIKEIREAAGISQVMLYRQLGWSQARLSNYEQGIRKVGLDEARSVVSALCAMGAKCTLDEVFPPADSSKPHSHRTAA